MEDLHKPFDRLYMSLVFLPSLLELQETKSPFVQAPTS